MDTANRVGIIRFVPLFDGLDMEALAAVAEAAREQGIAKGGKPLQIRL
jgi:hypothetical protein